VELFLYTINTRVKKPLDAVALTVRNIELFKRNLEALQNNQFELVNTNFRSFADKIEETNKNTVKLLSNLNNNLNKFFNFHTNNSVVGIRQASNVQLKSVKSEPSEIEDCILLDDDSDDGWLPSLSPRPRPAHSSTLNIVKLESQQPRQPQSQHQSQNQSQNQSQLQSQQPRQQPRQHQSQLQSQQPRQPLRPLSTASNIPESVITYQVDYARLVTVTSRYVDTNRVAVAAFCEMWKDDIAAGVFKAGLYNVYGCSPKGSHQVRYPLDSGKVILLQNFVKDKMPHGQDKDLLWRRCVTAIHKKLYTLKDHKSIQKSNGSHGSFGSNGSDVDEEINDVF
jgi:hypothetical protein